MNNQDISLESRAEQLDFGLSSFFAGIYKWMAIGVFVSALFAGITIYTHAFDFIFSARIFFYGLIGVELLLVFGIQMIINKVTPQTATALFLAYAAVNGVTMSVIFAIYSIDTIIQTFAGAIVLYIVLAVMGYRTKIDLSSWGAVLAPTTIAIIVMSVLNMLVFHSSVFHMVISVVVLIVFSALTIYDNQAYKVIYHGVKNDEKNYGRYTILGALHMYINFVAIFQSLLSLFGGGRD